MWARSCPPKREILRDISLSFFPGAKIGVLGMNGSGKSSLLRIMAGVDTDYVGEARPQPGIKIGYLAQEPQLDATKDVRGNVEEAVHAITSSRLARPPRSRVSNLSITRLRKLRNAVAS